jgi:hypothetical protein
VCARKSPLRAGLALVGYDPTSGYSLCVKTRVLERRHLLVVACVASLLTACSDNRSGIWLRISNNTDETIVISYEEPGHHMDLGTVEPGRAEKVTAVFDDLGPSCHDPFVAKSRSGQEVARLDSACPNVDWSVDSPVPSG